MLAALLSGGVTITPDRAVGAWASYNASYGLANCTQVAHIYIMPLGFTVDPVRSRVAWKSNMARDSAFSRGHKAA